MIFNSTLLVAIIVPNNPKIFKIVATHNDSPVLKIRPSALTTGSRRCSDACILHNEKEVTEDTSEKRNIYNHVLDETEKNVINTDQISNRYNDCETCEYTTIPLSTYGGGLWHTWFDRSLGVAGTIITKSLKQKLIKTNGLFYIPSLAIHLDKADVYKEGFKYNKEQHLRAYGMEGFKNLICNDDILSYDLMLYDVDVARLIGANKEYVVSARQDNLLSTFCAIKSIINKESRCNGIMSMNKNIYAFKKQDKLKDFEIKEQKIDETINEENCNNIFDDDQKSIKIVAVFDNEEIGSLTISGARTEMFKDIISSLKNKFNINLNHSIIISCDVAHGLNHNYKEKYESDHAPILGKGIVIKHSSGYSTNCFTSAYIKKLTNKFQEFCLRNDCLGGGTVGPMLVAGLGIKGVDIGAPILGMHSIKEMSHVNDIYDNYKLFQNFFN
ncbi:hypothetical protein COBT_003583 [Conglomerata obtusa]